MSARIPRQEVRRIARRYVITLLRSQDMPDWPIAHGLIRDTDDVAMTEFMDEVRRIADRIERMLPAAPLPEDTHHGR